MRLPIPPALVPLAMVLAIIVGVSARPRPPSILNAFSLMATSNMTIDAESKVVIRDSEVNTPKTYNPDDKIPIKDLPVCYQDCMELNRLNMGRGVNDVFDMTTREFCNRKRLVEAWYIMEVMYCVKDKCVDTCFPECQAASNVWGHEVCGW